MKSLKKSYTARITYNPNYPIGSKENKEWLKSQSTYLYRNILKSARAYYNKHELSDKARFNSRSKPKDVTITIEDIERAIIKSNGVSPDGTPIYFGPITLQRNPTKAIQLGLMSRDESMRKPSVDRIDSKNGYVNGNIQITTMAYNLGKGVGNGVVLPKKESPAIVVRFNGIEVQFSEIPDSTYLANYTSSLANR
jgi:hypothetical protein